MNRKIFTTLLVVFVTATVAVGAYFLNSRGTTDQISNQAASEKDTHDSISEEQSIDELLKNAVIVNRDKPIKFATQTLRVNSAKFTNVLASQYVEPVTSSPGATFLIINVTVTNDSDTPFLFRDYKLFDSENRMYEASDDAYVLDDTMVGRKLGPGVAETGSVVYEVPKGAADFKIGGPNADTGRIYLIKLGT
jgi:hypothetical protein